MKTITSIGALATVGLFVAFAGCTHTPAPQGAGRGSGQHAEAPAGSSGSGSTVGATAAKGGASTATGGSGTEAGKSGTAAAAETTGGSAARGGRTTARRGMMGGGGMMARGMMGGMMSQPADTAAAPEATAAKATAPECPTVSQALVDEGRKIFTGGQGGTCFACHGSDARGTAAAPNLTDSTWLNINGSYAAVDSLVRAGVANPKGFPAPMPPKGGADLSPAQVCSVAAYVYSLSH